MSRRVLVTGGLGFQGQHVTSTLLLRGDQVSVLTTPSTRNMVARATLHAVMDQVGCPRDRLGISFGSVGDAEILEKTVPGHDAVIHMAAWASVDASLDRPWPAFEVNALGTLAVLEACRRFGDSGVKVLLASSCEVYGPTRPALGVGGDVLAQTEEWPFLPRSTYAASKIAADRQAYAHAITYNMDITILRPCNIYGPGQLATAMGAVIPKMTRAALTDQPILVTGEGKQFREFLYVTDLVAAYLAVLDAPRGEPGATYNVGSGETRTIRALAERIAQVRTPPARIEQAPARVADVSGFLLDSSRFRERFGWTPQVPFEQGITQYLDWARR